MAETANIILLGLFLPFDNKPIFRLFFDDTGPAGLFSCAQLGIWNRTTFLFVRVSYRTKHYVACLAVFLVLLFISLLRRVVFLETFLNDQAQGSRDWLSDYSLGNGILALLRLSLLCYLFFLVIARWILGGWNELFSTAGNSHTGRAGLVHTKFGKLVLFVVVSITLKKQPAIRARANDKKRSLELSQTILQWLEVLESCDEPEWGGRGGMNACHVGLLFGLHTRRAVPLHALRDLQRFVCPLPSEYERERTPP